MRGRPASVRKHPKIQAISVLVPRMSTLQSTIRLQKYILLGPSVRACNIVRCIEIILITVNYSLIRYQLKPAAVVDT